MVPGARIAVNQDSNRKKQKDQYVEEVRESANEQLDPWHSRYARYVECPSRVVYLEVRNPP